MKRLFTIIFLTIAIGIGAAFGQSQKAARQILDKAAANISAKSGAKASFSVSGSYGNTSGTVLMKGSKYCISTPQSVVWCDGKTQWTYMKSSQEVNVTTPAGKGKQTINPYSLIYLYKKGYNMTSKSVAGVWQVHLTAQRSSASIKEMYITVSKGYQLKQVKVRQSKGWSTFNVSNFRKAALSDSQFRFNQKDYPKAEVIDLR